MARKGKGMTEQEFNELLKKVNAHEEILTKINNKKYSSSPTDQHENMSVLQSSTKRWSSTKSRMKM